MYLIDLIKQISLSLWVHKVRTALALFGIVWGTITVIVLLAVSNGFYSTQVKNLAFLKNGIILGWGARTSKPYAGNPQGRKIHIKTQDFIEIANTIPGIKSVSPLISSEAKISFNDKFTVGSLNGVAAGYEEMQQMGRLPGDRFIDPVDIAARNNVVFLDSELKTLLFGNKEAVGKTIMINGLPFTVIGSADPKKSSPLNFDTQHNTYIPYTTYLAIAGPSDVHTFFLTPENIEDTSRIKHNLKNIFAMKYHFDPTDDDAIMIPDLASAQKFVTWFFRIVELFFGFCGLLTLSVGGLGTANMMFLIVTERTREIGLRMALGAKPMDIYMQFLCETLLIVTLGGTIGFFISAMIISFLNKMSLPEWLGVPYISWASTIITISILIVVGFAAGYFPARRAAKMEPVKALAFQI